MTENTSSPKQTSSRTWARYILQWGKKHYAKSPSTEPIPAEVVDTFLRTVRLNGRVILTSEQISAIRSEVARLGGEASARARRRAGKRDKKLAKQARDKEAKARQGDLFKGFSGA